MNQPRIAYGLGEAAGLIGISSSKLRKLIRSGELRSTRVGRRVLLRSTEIDKLLRRGERPQPSPAA